MQTAALLMVREAWKTYGVHSCVSVWAGPVTSTVNPRPFRFCISRRQWVPFCPNDGFFSHPLSSREYFVTICRNLSQPQCSEWTYQVDLWNMKSEQSRQRSWGLRITSYQTQSLEIQTNEKSNKHATQHGWNHFLWWSLHCLGALSSNCRYLPYDFRAERAEEIYFFRYTELPPLQESLWAVTGIGNLTGLSCPGSLDTWISVGWHGCIPAGYFLQQESFRSTREPHVLVSEGRPPQLGI